MNDSIDESSVNLHRELPEDFFRVARSDARGVPTVGRAAEIDALRQAGNREPSLGRIYEGHVNGAQLVARCGSDGQREQLDRDLAAGHVFGVWNTQDADGVRIESAGDRLALRGAKTWASGAGTVSRALITATRSDGGLQMLLLPMDRIDATIDRSGWLPMGMERSDSFRVAFDGVQVGADALIGAPGDYEAQPWFGGGALRFLAVHAGIVERLESEFLTFLIERNRHTDTLQRVRAAQLRVAVQTCRHWLRAGVEAWMLFDADPTSTNAGEVLYVVDMARVVIERAALDAVELATRGVGARGLIEPSPIGRIVRDLQMYLRQPAPDAVLLRVGAQAFSAAAAARNPSIDASTGTSG